MVINTAIFKVSGKILDNSKHVINTIAQLTHLYEDKIIQKIILIPGGGTLANFVRKVYFEFKINEDLAHWIAIYSMNYNGLELERKFSHLQTLEDFEHLKNVQRGFLIFLPFKYLRSIDPLPHSWDVTSDSIALYCAHKLGLSDCFLIKDVDGVLDKNSCVIKEISTKQLRKLKSEKELSQMNTRSSNLKERTKPIDTYITKLIDLHKINSIILNGVSPNLLIFNYFSNIDQESKIYSKIYYE